MLKNKKNMGLFLFSIVPGKRFSLKILFLLYLERNELLTHHYFICQYPGIKITALVYFQALFTDFSSVYVNKTMSRGNARPEKYDFSCRMKQNELLTYSCFCMQKKKYVVSVWWYLHAHITFFLTTYAIIDMSRGNAKPDNC